MFISILYAITCFVCLTVGIHYVFLASLPALGVHFLLFGLYFLICFYEKQKNPFSSGIYLLTIILLLASGVLQVLVTRDSSIAVFSFLLVLSLQLSYQGAKKKKEEV